jgi:nucleotide-binding universal stress UspA family protein
MFGTIVWATDGSPYADAPLPFILELGVKFRSRIVALHVNELFMGRAGGCRVLTDEAEMRKKIAAQVEELRAQGLDAELRVVTTHRLDTAAQIAEAAERARAEAIVIGTRGLGELGTLLHGGSVARGLTHIAGVPVIVVPPTPVGGRAARPRRAMAKKTTPVAVVG